jgi:NTP pyrophosphatase (non-canonical NTP hydrolase)
MSELAELRQGMRAFTDERGWGSFHDPKSVLLALVGEVGELAELLQWLPADEVRARTAEEPLRTRVGEEMADVLLYLVLLADVLDLDLGGAAAAKLAAAHGRYPAAEVAGRAPGREV